MESDAVWLSAVSPARNSSAPMSMAVFAASSLASLFFAKIGWVVYERCTPSGLVMDKMHCLSMQGQGRQNKDWAGSLLALCSMNSNFKASVFRNARWQA